MGVESVAAAVPAIAPEEPAVTAAPITPVRTRRIDLVKDVCITSPFITFYKAGRTRNDSSGAVGVDRGQGLSCGDESFTQPRRRGDATSARVSTFRQSERAQETQANVGSIRSTIARAFGAGQ